ncbi:hypothetical protein [Streptomyces sp. NPDC054940]
MCGTRVAGLRHPDPEGRALHLSVGAAVLKLRFAMAHFGWDPVTRLLPRPGEPDLLASVRPTGPAPGRPRGGDIDLYGAVWRRHSSRFLFSDRPIPPYLRVELAAAADAEGARLRFPEHAATARLLALTMGGEQRNLFEPTAAPRAASGCTGIRTWRPTPACRGRHSAGRPPGNGSPCAISPGNATPTSSSPAPRRQLPSSPC